MSSSVSIQAIAEGGAISSITKRVVTLMFLVALVDSYDQISMAFAAPAFVAEWGIEKGEMGQVFSIQLLGLLIGGIMFGVVGDRYGRKSAVILGLILFGVLSLLTMAASSVTELLLIRFLVGLGVGGVIPNAIALSNEFSPKRFQVTAVSLMFVGYVCGGVGGGMVSAWLLPVFGWEVIFLLGGAVPIVLAAILIFALPESIQYLAGSDKSGRQLEATRLAALMRPDLAITPETQIVDEAVLDEKLTLCLLFAGPLKAMTLLLWLLYIANSITAFALVSWMPILIESIGFQPKVAALATSLLFGGAAIGGVVMSHLVDRAGLGPIILMPAIGIPFLVGVGFLGGSAPAVLFLFTGLLGFFVFGFQNCLHGIGGSIYPSRVRAMGVGWALGAGKIGGILGPLVGGILISAGAAPQTVFIAASAPLLVSLLAVAMLRGVYGRNIRSGQASGGRVAMK